MKNFFLSCKEIKIEPSSPKTYYGCFYLGPFQEGQGLTVANALRRTLLTEIPGIAITSVKIDGISHEYASLTGVRETVVDILLNLKEIVLKKTFEKPLAKTQIGYLQVRGPGTIRAADLKLPPMFECVDPDQYIATLSENGKLALTFTIDEAKNFSFRKTQINNDKSEYVKEKFLEIDPIFTPIKKVNYILESYGSQNLYKSNQVIVLEIWTNGSIYPKESISYALNYLKVLFDELGKLKVLESIFTTYSLTKNKPFQKVFNQIDKDLDFINFSMETNKMGKSNQLQVLNDFQTPLLTNQSNSQFNKGNENLENSSLSNLGLPFRLFNLLTSANILTVKQLLTITSKDLYIIPGFDDKLFSILKEILRFNNLLEKSKLELEKS